MDSQPQQPEYDVALHTRRAMFLLFGLVLAVFGISVTFDFVNWDDPWYIHRNPLVQSWSFQNLYGICTETVTRNFAPLTIFSYLIDHSLWGKWAGGYHLTNVLLHGINAILVFLLVRQITTRHVFALVVALLFAIHPIQIESVVWISARKGLLSSAFILLSLLFWLKRERTSQDELSGTILFVVALMCKASAVVVPGIVFVYDIIVRRRSFADSLARQFVSGLLAIWFILLTAGSQNSQTGGIRHHLGHSKLEILGIDSVLMWKYVGMLLWPTDLAILYDPTIQGIGAAIAVSVFAWGIIAVWIWMKRESQPLILFASLSALALMIPVLNFFPLTTLMNDRYLYLPCIAFFGLMVAAVESVFYRGMAVALSHRSPQNVESSGASAEAERPRHPDFSIRTLKPQTSFRIAALTAGLVVLAYSAISVQQLSVWRNDSALWKQASQVSPELPVVQYQYALAEWRTGEHQAAITRLENALQLERVDDLDRERFNEKLQIFKTQFQELQLNAAVSK
ncbi:hypothetical protein [Rubinisphaera italica]|uniref:Glycosyltransferase RgtA/B/C/D-like domain-containing protein n=1 Tax=Rubinisphaera italica TaxID=2527969 RepID=A0A5C5XAZ3_9PLAN|nr:hypothetical protein [Rubinisphaera italica]TWT59819.1 hypothetical protein Pan54_05300 [Rubinisphaera italica]